MNPTRTYSAFLSKEKKKKNYPAVTALKPFLGKFQVHIIPNSIIAKDCGFLLN